MIMLFLRKKRIRHKAPLARAMIFYHYLLENAILNLHFHALFFNIHAFLPHRVRKFTPPALFLAVHADALGDERSYDGRHRHVVGV